MKLHIKQNSSTGRFCDFFEICKNTYLSEHHRMTAFDYSNINRCEGNPGKPNYELSYRN